VKKTSDRLTNNLLKRLKEEGWSILHTESFKLSDNKKVFELIGVSSSFGGSTVLSLSVHGARNVSFFVKITEKNNKESSLLIIASGSQDIWELDFGRNTKVGEKLFEFCTLVPYKERVEIAEFH
jgi:hypothetical protein